jgi:hypothetical protein
MKVRTFLAVLLVEVGLATPQGLAIERLVPTEYPTIQAAINACGNDDVVIVEPNTYTGDGNRDIDFLGKAITVRSTNPDDPNVVASTVIKCNPDDPNAPDDPNDYGNHRGFVFQSGEGSDSIVDGLTIVDGYAEEGGGIYCLESSPTIMRCNISRNTAETISGLGKGGGLCLTYSNAKVANCLIGGNTGQIGGGITVIYDSPHIENCTISGNGGVGVNCVDSSPVMSNCTVCRNDGGGVLGIASSGSITLDIANCILWDNGGADETDQISSLEYPSAEVTLRVAYSHIQGCTAHCDDPNDHNASDDPQFVDPNGPDGDPATWQDNDYHLTPTSLCIDAGDPNGDYAGQADIDGHPRVMPEDGAVDIGSDEYPGAPWYYRLNVSRKPEKRGSVRIESPQPCEPPCVEFIYPAGTVVTLTAEPNEGSSFHQWKIYDPNYPGDNQHATFYPNAVYYRTMDANWDVQAQFSCGDDTAIFLPTMLGALGLFMLIARRR